MAKLIEKFNWFCGQCKNKSDVCFYNFEDFDWTFHETIYNGCMVGFLSTLPHLLFLLVGVLVLLILYCFCGYNEVKSNFLLKYPGHNLRWVLNYFFLNTLLIAVGEGIASDVSNAGYSTQPYLYVPSSVALLAAFLAIIFYHHLECWNVKWMSLILCLYWILAFYGEILKLLFICYELPEYANLQNMRFVAICVSVQIYGILVVIEIVAMFKVVCRRRPVYFPDDLKMQDMYYVQGYTNLLSTTLFWWMNWLFRTGFKTALEISDLGSLSNVHTAEYNRDQFEKALNYEYESSRKTGKGINLYRVYMKVNGLQHLGAAALKLLGDSLALLIPIILGAVINYAATLYSGGTTVSMDEPTLHLVSVTDFASNGAVLVVALFILSYTRALLLQLHYHVVIVESAHIKVALQAAVYDKVLRLSTYTISGGMMTMGQITNHMSVDPVNVANCYQMIHYIWAIPLQLIGYLIILYYQLGFSALIGSSLFIISIPLQTVIAKQLGACQKKSMGFADDRLKQTNEMLQGMKLIKLYAWEEIFLKSIGNYRFQQILMMLQATVWRVLLYTITTAFPLIVTLVTFALHQTLTGHPLTPAITFTALAIFNQMFVPLLVLPIVFSYCTNAMVSTGRLKGFFSAPEIEGNDYGQKSSSSEDNQEERPDTTISDEISDVEFRPTNKRRSHQQLPSRDVVEEEHRFTDQQPLNGDIDIKVTDGTFTWDKDSATPIISDVNVEIPAGKLTMIVGKVGSGKSSLIAALLGEMTTLSGTVQWNSRIGSVAYAAQRAWLLNASLKDNVLFGEPFDKDRYDKIIHASSLKPDIEILPGGDETEIGEKGINLSGGQKQRISVARAMYSSNQVVILDDPLSALDVHVGAHLFEEGIKNLLLKEGRTVILVTHQIQYLDSADLVLLMKDGVIEQGCKAAESHKLRGIIRAISEDEESESEGEKESKSEGETENPSRQTSKTEGKLSKEEEEEDKEKGKLTEEEERNKGSVSWRIYWKYISTFNVFLFLLCISLAVLQNAAVIGTNFVLSAWTDAGENATFYNVSDTSYILHKYLPQYAALSVVGILFQTVSTAVILLFSLRAAWNIHNYMLRSIMHAPMRFFDTTPVGRVLNRFSSDMQVIDVNIGQTVNSFCGYSIACLGAVVVNAIIAWYFVIAIIPVGLFYLLLMKYFITTSRELQRLESISRSPIFAHFSESLGGLTTIRAYNVSSRFEEDILRKLERNNTAYLYLQTCNRWLGTRLDFIGAVVVFIAAVVSLVSCLYGNIVASQVGLAITYALSISDRLNWVIRTAADMETQMNAVERTSHYTALDAEDYEGTTKPASSWPSEGGILFADVKARYSETLDPVLHGVNIQFRPGQKIGICGRTGSGKSSLTLTLFRMIDMFQGKITIDGEDISKVPLTDLRRKLSIIPQDPVLFTGSVRFNLDPFSERNDDELWEALEIAQLKDVVRGLNLGLDGEVTEGGENFSVGQRQLFCLARAFLRKSKILVMDEATASIDIETDAILQSVVATAFKDRTVLTIAHRVATIMDSDKILTLDEGNVVEYDAPETLLGNKDSIFASLVNAKT